MHLHLKKMHRTPRKTLMVNMPNASGRMYRGSGTYCTSSQLACRHHIISIS